MFFLICKQIIYENSPKAINIKLLYLYYYFYLYYPKNICLYISIDIFHKYYFLIIVKIQFL